MHEHSSGLPEVRINFSMLLYRGECRRLDLILNNGQNQIASPGRYEAKAKQYRNAWAEYEMTLLQGMTEALGVSFYRPVIDVTLAPYFGHKSTPLIINFRPNPDRFVDVLTHELLHVLQTDNNKHQSNGPHATLYVMTEWRKLFGHHDRMTLVHIPLHALHKYLYLDILKAPERLERDLASIEASPSGESYVKAWHYVNAHDYMEIVNELRDLYKRV